MRRTGRVLCLILIFAFVLGAGAAGAAGGTLAKDVFAAGGFETVPGSVFAADVEGGTLRSLLPGTTVRTVVGNFKTVVSVCKADGTVAGDEEIVCTGCVVKDAAGDELPVAVVGDVTGDGAFTVADCIAIKQHLNGTVDLSGVWLSAADADNDGYLADPDYVALRRGIKGASDLYSGFRGSEYEIVFSIPKYASAADAAAQTGSTGAAAVGTYYVHRNYPAGLDGMYCLTENASASGECFWIDPSGNIPAAGTPYVLTRSMPKYVNAADAKAQTNSTGTASAGTYFIYEGYPDGLDGVYNITTDRDGKVAGFWVNPADSPTGANGVIVLSRSVNKYKSPDDAARQANIDGVAAEGSYRICEEYPNGIDGMCNVAEDGAGADSGFWINPCENTGGKLNYKTMKALWISQFDMKTVYVASYASGPRQTEKEQFRYKVKTILKEVKNCGYNTVMVQVRPNGDSFYASAYFPWSKYVTGAYGTDATYDPFPIIIEEARKLALSVHAWVNPMRLMSVTDIESIGTDNTIGQWHADPDKEGKYIVAVDGYYYLNPGYDEVRDLIVNGVSEICENYNVDGVHFDDYFYPEGVTNDFDREAFEACLQLPGTEPSWRIRLVNNFVERVHTVCHEDGIVFGIAPQGTISVNQQELYADVKTWCKTAGYVDYIAPQLYWGLEGTGSKFDEKLAEWEDLVRGHDVKLVPAMTLQHAYDASLPEWVEHKDVIKREMRLAENCTNFGGVMIFSLKNFYNPSSSTYTNQLVAERANYEPVLKAMYIGG